MAPMELHSDRLQKAGTEAGRYPTPTAKAIIVNSLQTEGFHFSPFSKHLKERCKNCMVPIA